MRLQIKILTLFIIAFSLSSGISVAKTKTVPDQADAVEPVEVGADAPEALFVTADGKQLMTKDLLDGKPTALIFYRGGWCPYCNRQLADLGKVESELRALGVQLIGISPDKPEKVKAAVEAADYDYQLVSDSSADAAKAFGVAFRVDDETYAKLISYKINLEDASGQNHRILPVPAVFLIDASGKIVFRYFNPDYSLRLSGTDLLSAAQKAIVHAE